MTIGPAPTVRSSARNRAAPDPLSAYLTRISRGSLLMRGEEIELGVGFVQETGSPEGP
jgi:hypothetical protein